MGAIKCKHAPNGECGVSVDCRPVERGLRCARLKDGLLRFFNPANSIAIVWSIGDVRKERPHLTNEQAMEVLEEASDSHDDNYGVNWDTLRDIADSMFPGQDGEEEREYDYTESNLMGG